MEEAGRGHSERSALVCSVPVPGTATGPADPFVPPADAAAGLADLLLPELADWLGRLRGQRERRGLHWTAAQLQPGAAPEPAAATSAAVLATEPSTGGEGEETRRDEAGEGKRWVEMDRERQRRKQSVQKAALETQAGQSESTECVSVGM